MPRISADEYRNRLECLRAEVAEAGLDLFLVSSFDNTYYLTGAGFEPLERPFFLLVTPPGAGEPALLVPRPDAEHMKNSQSAAPRSAQPHSVPALSDRLREGPHVALAFLRVNGYAAESERTYFTARPNPEMERAFRALEEGRSIALRMIRPGVACSEIDAAVSTFLRGSLRAAPTYFPRTWS